MITKLRVKFVLINMAIVLGLLLVIIGLVYHFQHDAIERQTDQALAQLAENISPQAPPNRNIRQQYLTLYIYPNGDVLSAGTTHYDFSKMSFIEKLVSEVYETGKSSGVLEKYQFKFKVIVETDCHKMAFIDISGNKQALSDLIQNLLITGGIAIAAFCVVSILLAFWSVRPVSKAWKQQKQFISDASHELKTPLTVIMSNAELLRGEECDEESRLKFSSNILKSSQQMRSLVECLLELTRADNGQMQLGFAPFNFSIQAQNAVLPFEPLFFERSMSLVSTVEPDIIINGSQSHLQQLIDILLDNAAKYSDPGIVELHLERCSQSQCLLTVSNPGNPIPEKDLKRIFGRFYRADTARANNGSFGLGLSIAQSIVEQHGGKIWAESNETGSRFNILLPCDSNSQQ